MGQTTDRFKTEPRRDILRAATWPTWTQAAATDVGLVGDGKQLFALSVSGNPGTPEGRTTSLWVLSAGLANGACPFAG